MADGVEGVELIWRSAICDETAEVLAEESAELEEGSASLQAMDDFCVGWRLGNHRIEPDAETGAMVGANVLGFVALGVRDV